MQYLKSIASPTFLRLRLQRLGSNQNYSNGGFQFLVSATSFTKAWFKPHLVQHNFRFFPVSATSFTKAWFKLINKCHEPYLQSFLRLRLQRLGSNLFLIVFRLNLTRFCDFVYKGLVQTKI